jgi:hypothetical protein
MLLSSLGLIRRVVFIITVVIFYTDNWKPHAGCCYYFPGEWFFRSKSRKTNTAGSFISLSPSIILIWIILNNVSGVLIKYNKKGNKKAKLTIEK